MRHQALAIDEGIVEVGIAGAVTGDGAIDVAAEEDFGLARGAHRPAGLDRRRVGHVVERKVLAVAKPHAIGDEAATAASRLHRSEIGRQSRQRRRRLGIGRDVGRRSGLLLRAEQKVENAGARRSRRRNQ